LVLNLIKHRILTTIFACFSFLHLKAPTANSADNQNKNGKENLIHGDLTADKQNKYLTYSIPSMAAPENWTWWHEIRPSNTKTKASLSKNKKHLLIHPNENAKKIFQIDIESQLIPRSDLVLKLNQIQIIGTHNSYHIAPVPQVMKIIKSVIPNEAVNISYTHRVLTEQLKLLGMRKFELDIFHDTKGGTFASPLGPVIAGLKNWKSFHPEFDTESMMSPGMKIIHFPNFDFRSNTPTLKAALSELNKWSSKNNLHLPIMILIESKKTIASAKENKSTIFNVDDFRQLEKEINEVIELEKIITPNKVQGEHMTLNQAIRKGAWPLLAECRGKFILALDNEGEERSNYLKLHPELEGALLFVSSPPGNPESAFLKINDPTENHAEIQKRINQGYLIRTRSDSNLTEGRTNDYRQMNLAFSSGAQYISTDFPEKMPGFSDYNVQWPDAKVGRLNPLFKFDHHQVILEPENLNSQIILRQFSLKTPTELAK
jgi:hypothetical protein